MRGIEPMSDPAYITAILKRIRRRQFLVLFLEAEITALCVSAFLAACSWIRIWRIGKPSIQGQLALGAVLLFASLLVSFFRMPSWKNTAKRIDRALDLQQRLETAWECIPPREEIDLLLIKDASQRLAWVRSSAVLPVRLGNAAKISLMVSLLAITGLGIVNKVGGWNRNPSPSAVSTRQAVAGAQASSKRGSPAHTTHGTESASEKSQASANSGSDRKPGLQTPKSDSVSPDSRAPEQAPMQPAQSSSMARIPDKGAASQSNRGTASTESAKQGTIADSNKEAPAQEVGRWEAHGSQSNGLNRAAADQGLAARPDPGAASVRRAGRESGKANTDALAGSRTESESRGLLSGRQTGQALKKSDLTAKDARVLAQYLREYPRIWSVAEQAMGKEKIPPGFSKYIADYFKAIHQSR